MLIAYYLGFTNRKRKYIEERTAATLKSKQTSIATVRKHLLTVVSLRSPPIFRYPQPLREKDVKQALVVVESFSRELFTSTRCWIVFYVIYYLWCLKCRLRQLNI